MKKLFILLFLVVVMAGCAINRVTGRKQLSLVKESELRLMATTEYSKFLTENKILNAGSSSEAAMVDRVGARISRAITDYYNSEGKPSVLEGYKWEFNTVDDKSVINAWCMPGGKVVVYTGLLPVTRNETGLAIVMGHEIAHSVAKHG